MGNNIDLSEIYKQSLKVYGVKAQLSKTGEESSELSKAIHRYTCLSALKEHNFDLFEKLDLQQQMEDTVGNIIEEIVDAHIMLEQMKLAGWWSDEVFWAKIERCIKRLEKAEDA